MKLNYGKLFVINYLYIVAIELSFKLMVIKTFDIGIVYILIFSLIGASIVTFLSSLSKRRGVNRAISIIIYFVLLIFGVTETVYYSFYKSIYGLSGLSYGGQVMEFFSAILSHVKANIFIIGIIIAMFLLMLFVTSFISFKKYNRHDALSLIIVTLLIAFSSLELNFNGVHDLIYNRNDLMATANNMGINTALVSDSLKAVFGFEESIRLSISDREFTKDEKLEYNTSDIDFDKLIEKEKDSTVKDMHTYFSSEMPTNKNEYTGLFAGKNLIFIVAEGFYPIAVDENITPTLYKLVNNGLVFDNYYQPIYNCSTSDGEFINQLSILPGVSTCSMKSTMKNYLPYNLGLILPKYGYKANAFHGWTYNYYSRDKIMPNLGYTYYGYDRFNKGYKYALKGIEYAWPTSDIDVINSSYDIYKNEERFVTYYMSISGHLEYNFTGGNAMALKNREAVKDMDAKESIKAYVATQVEFDRSLEILINNLDRDGILDDTVIVISPDHYPYGLTNADIASYVDWMQNPEFDLYKNNLVIYNSEMETKHVGKYTSSLDLLPTLLNLFGVEYDSRLLIGKDIFSEAEDLVIFNNKSWITKVGRYNYLKKKFETFSDEEVSQDYIDKINAIVELKFQMSKLLISKDYYRKLGEI